MISSALDELSASANDRVEAIHWKDTEMSYRGYTGLTPTRAMHDEKILYKDLGTGGCDIPANWKLLQDRGYQGWITVELYPYVDDPDPAARTAHARVRELLAKLAG